MSSNEEPAQGGGATVTWPDGHTIPVGSLDRPAILVRLERAYPEVSAGDRASFKLEHWYYMAWLALRLELAEGNPYRPGDDFDTWLEEVGDVTPTDPTPELEEATP
jgi:hypothetical protein